jgi:D-sedoheptulose 7-phosphate isomerase
MNIMKKFVIDFFERMQKTLSGIECYDKADKALEINDSIVLAYETIVAASKNGKKIMLIGNGGSASIASHIAVDIWKNGGVKAISFNDSSLLTCISNDLGFENVFSAPIEMFAEKGDVLIAISSSGNSKNILNGCKTAAKMGCKVITMSGFSADNKLKKLGDLNFFVPFTGYGYVETAHTVLCHVLVDCVIKTRNSSN